MSIELRVEATADGEYLWMIVRINNPEDYDVIMKGVTSTIEAACTILRRETLKEAEAENKREEEEAALGSVFRREPDPELLKVAEKALATESQR